MTDVIDQAQAHEEMHRAHALAAATAPRPRGPVDCEECGESISDLRRDLGARRCITCQEAHEHRTGAGRRV